MWKRKHHKRRTRYESGALLLSGTRWMRNAKERQWRRIALAIVRDGGGVFFVGGGQ